MKTILNILNIESWIGFLTALSCFLAPLALYLGWIGGIGIESPYTLMGFYWYGFIPLAVAAPMAISSRFHSSRNSLLLMFAVILTGLVFVGVQSFRCLHTYLYVNRDLTYYFAIPVVLAIATMVMAILGQLVRSRPKNSLP